MAMWQCFLPLTIILTIFTTISFCYVPRESPTKGEIWPKPQFQSRVPSRMLMDPDMFEFKVIGKTCPLLEDALVRYKNILVQQAGGFSRADGSKAFPFIRTLSINLMGACEEWPKLNMDEAYNLNVNDTTNSVLNSNSIWGAMRGLETFSQMVYMDNYATGDLMINSTTIMDFPRFTHRGLLVDTCRHYITLANILKIMDGMVYNKLNVFHWHITDDTCFPYVSLKYPSLSEKGAYQPKYIYSQSDTAKLIEYARVRGIRVIPEFDTPGHTEIWREAYPRLLTPCYGDDGKVDDRTGPFNPIDEYVYDFMKEFYDEITSVFPEKYVHVGGDEVDFTCWKSNPNITKYMADFNITSYGALEGVYVKRLLDIVDKLKGNSVVWQEVFTNGAQLPAGTVVQSWLGDQKAMLANITSRGLPALLSNCWYLDHLAGNGLAGGDWKKFYSCDPHDFNGTAEQKKLVLGGEACMWAEVVDNDNIVQRIFPRASAMAEKLWSAVEVNNVTEARFRLEEHYCRMKKRGIPAQPPNGPGFCV